MTKDKKKKESFNPTGLSDSFFFCAKTKRFMLRIMSQSVELNFTIDW